MKCEIFIFILFLFVFNDLSEDGFNYFRLKETSDKYHFDRKIFSVSSKYSSINFRRDYFHSFIILITQSFPIFSCFLNLYPVFFVISSFQLFRIIFIHYSVFLIIRFYSCNLNKVLKIFCVRI